MTVVFAERGAACAAPAPGHAPSTAQILAVLEGDRRSWLPATVTRLDPGDGRITVQPASGAPFEAYHHDPAAVARFLPLGRGCLWNAEQRTLIGPEIVVARPGRRRLLRREIVRRALSLAPEPVEACPAGAGIEAGHPGGGPPPEPACYPTAGGPTNPASADRCSAGSRISR
ncbi:hypothetical protein [Zhihengliuella sp.]|uniref:hypothetical protein n=1 Tax=Zhihengliuella sp. TaxID=1954483 RepID=UPI002811E2DB|nr:hypothetical protein [Zhihengliuella sp.]